MIPKTGRGRLAELSRIDGEIHPVSWVLQVAHSARLLSRGPAKVAQKFGEEAVECVIEAILANKDAVIAESADVLYHLLVLWVASDVAPRDVWAELQRREGISGVAEKASRVKSLSVASGVETKKIP